MKEHFLYNYLYMGQNMVYPFALFLAKVIFESKLKLNLINKVSVYVKKLLVSVWTIYLRFVTQNV